MDAQAQREAIETRLRAALRLALLDPSDDWSEPVIRLASVLIGRTYRELFDKRLTAAQQVKIVNKVRDLMVKSDRDAQSNTAQASLLSSGAANYITSALMRAGTGPGWVKEWVTMGDDKVRESHRAAASAGAIPASEKFDVGGHQMDAPGDLAAPVEEWAGCRCHSVYRRENEDAPALVAGATPTGALVAAVSAMSSEGFLAVSRELFDEAIRNGTAVPVGVRDDGVVLYDLTAAAMPAEQNAFVIVGLPALADPIWNVSSEQPPHITVLYLSLDVIEQAGQILAGEAPKHQPLTLNSGSVEPLGDSDAIVLHVEPGMLHEVRQALMGYEPIQQGYDAVQQYPEWTPHLTLGYPETPPLSQDVPATIVIDRLAILDGEGNVSSEYPLGEPMTDTVAEEPIDLNGDYPWEEVPLYGVIAPENVETGDKRKFLVDSLEWVEPPLSLSWQEVDQPGHDGACVTGRIERIWKDAGLWKWEGGLSMNAAADAMLALIAERALRGISVDLDDTEVEFQTSAGDTVTEGDVVDEEPTMAVAKGRIRKATVVAVPAFIEAFVAIGTWADHDQPNDKAGEAPEITEASLAATAASILSFGITSKPGTEDGPGWLTHPIDTDRLRDYWVHGEGAAKIGWGTPGDFNRCRVLLAPYVKAQYLAGYCANRHKDALGIWPGEHRGGALAASAAQAQLDHPELIAEPWTIIPRLEEEEAQALVAGGNSTLLRPPGWWFQRPPEFANIDKAQPVVVTDEGRVYGYAAEWGVCHLGFANECVYAPRSPSNYAWFRLGDKTTTDGNVPIGVITIGTGHAPLSMDAFHAAAHYDNTGTGVAQIASGDDEFGIWVAGCVRPSATPEQIDDLRASKLSGDWREIGKTRELDMIRVLAVNTPGFGIPRMALAASAGGEEYRTALVAAGVVESSDERIARLVKDGVEETLASRDRAESMKAIRSVVYARRRQQIAALAAARKD